MTKPVARSRAATTALKKIKEDLTYPRVLFFDIENAPNKSWVWGQYDQNVIAHVEEWYMLSVAWRWMGEKEVHVKCLQDYKGYKPGTPCDKGLTQTLWDLFDEADIVIAHNGDAFDIKKANSRFLFHGLNPPSPYQSVDTLKIARKYFKENSNKLNDLAKKLGIGNKVPHTGFALWDGCMSGDSDSWELMCKYNKQDVVLLEKVYERLKVWHDKHPSMAALQGRRGCPICGSPEATATKRGFHKTPLTQAQRYQCHCGKYYQGSRTKLAAATA